MPKFQLSATAASLQRSLLSKVSYLRTTLIYLGERMFGVVVSFAVYTALARVYGPEILGTYSYVQTVMLFAVPFLASGSEGIIIREYVRAKGSTSELMGSAFVVLSVTGIVTSFLPLAAIWLFQGDQRSLLYMAIFTAVGFVPSGFLVAEQAFKAEQKAAPIFIARICSALLGAAAKLYLIYFHFPIEAVVLATAAESFVLTALLLYFYSRNNSVKSWQFNAERALVIFWQSLPGMIAAITVMLFFRVNHIMLVYLTDFKTVGQYAVAFQTQQLFLVLPTVFFGAIYPRLVYLHTHDPVRYRTVVNISYYGFAVMGYMIMVFCLLFAKPLINLVFGPRYEIASECLIVFAISNLFNFSGSVRGRSIDIANSPQYHVWYSLLGLAILVPISLLVIPRFGAPGAAACIGISLFVSAILTTFFLPAIRDDALVQIKALFLIPSFRLSDL